MKILHLSLFLALAVLIGGIFSFFQVPAGWLAGSLLFGMGYRLFMGKLDMGNGIFKVAQLLIGINVGLAVPLGFFHVLISYVLPLILSLTLTIAGGLLLGKIFYTYSKLDPITAFFCCIPGGAVEVIAMSEDYGADRRIIAAFHSVRVVFIVMSVPILLYFITGLDIPRLSVNRLLSFHGGDLLIFAVLAALAWIVSDKVKIPAGSLIFSIFVGFAFKPWLSPIDHTIPMMTGIGQAWIGAVTGLEFDKEALVKLKKIGKSAILTLLLFLMMSIGISYLFYLISPLDFVMSFLSIVPSGAAEMSSIAYTLHLDAALVAIFQLTRLLLVVLIMPKLISFLFRAKESAGVE